MAYCIYTAASATTQDVRAGDLDARANMSTFLRALTDGLKSCPVIQRSIDIINNSLHGVSPEPRSISENNIDGFTRNYLPAFPYMQLDYMNDAGIGNMELDTSLLDSFPEDHIDSNVTSEWYWPVK